MLIDRFASGASPEYRWTGLENISPELAIAAIASEDQKFAEHHGFDLEAIREAREHNRRGMGLRGASTITQQVAKNLYLWPARSWIRKGLEVYFTLAIEVLWPKRRILEVYLNIAEFGPHIYGASAAAERHFKKTAADLNRHEAALLVAVLPSPKTRSVLRPGTQVKERARWVRGQIGRLGGLGALERLAP